ncbi:hypothetical protein H310_06753 [Aphanomyces invadans]|uniref:Palmitoyltransferase n=1 Tax=Aphanomyces invadans TaxID=157072 RepID=A0A024U4I6_9STRA|nr:hypothetical protein H310_06753 [Aphanomyces invadans]ETW01150.1 hypothetical protein H310_06753 [Aphanomyces invadans]|eukprot:XP_008870148.1 hypothetical protein H310_06753 [Aphanomyces invadans]
MRVFCRTCKECEDSSDATMFDEALTCAKCGGPYVQPSVFECAQYGLLDELKFLLDKEGESSPVDINMRDSHNATLLHWASLNNRLLVMMYLLDLPGIDINAVGGDLKSTPIYWASHRNNIYAVALLLEHHADPSIADANGIDAYFVAVQSGHTILASYMIAMGCDVDTTSQNTDKSTPLMWLCRYKFELDTMRMLIGLGANIHAVDANGYTALHWAASRDFAMAAKQLIDHGIDIYATTPKGETALDLSNRVASDIEDSTRGKRTAAAVGFLRKLHSRHTAFWTPWIVLGLAGYATHALHGVHVFIGVLGALAVGYALFSIAGLGVNPGKRKNAALMLGVNIGSTFWINFVFVTSIAAHVSNAESVLLMALVAGILVCLYFTATRDPGMIRTTSSERRRNIRELVDMKSRSEVKLCTTCIQRRPLRSKHDAELNGCVARFDHFCPFVANAVGANNHTYFLGFLVFAVAGIGYFLVLAWSYLSAIVAGDATYWGIVTHLAHDFPVVTSTCGLAVVHIAWIGYLLGANIYGILFAWTTNECVLQGRVPVDPAAPVMHHSKFSRGITQNVIDFFHLPIGHNRIDWTTARFYNLADVHTYHDNDQHEE